MIEKRGWIKIVEAFVAILLITGILLTIINKGYVEREDISQEVYDMEIGILREIQLDSVLRQDILDSGFGDAPQSVQDKVNEKKSSYLDCDSQVCDINTDCNSGLANSQEKDVYAQSTIITATTQDYKPRYIKLFCWVK